MKNPAKRKRTTSTISIEQLKRYGYSGSIVLAILSMATVLLFESPIFALSPATKTFDYIVYPIFILLGLWLIRAILRGRIAIERFEKPLVIVATTFVVSKYTLTMLSAETPLSLAYMESWYWLFVGVWTLSFLAFSFLPSLLINAILYLSALGANIAHIWIQSDPADRFDRLSDLAASNFRLGAMLTALVILGYVKDQWLMVEREAMLLRSIAYEDPLTGLPNRRWINSVLRAAVESAERSLTVILFDLDGFKEVNDRFGHTVGDEVLRQVGQLAQKHAGTNNTVGRWGGEEFLIICPNSELAEGIRIAENLRHQFATHKILQGRTITGSFGVAQLKPNESIESLIARADRALYAAKERGKNQVLAETPSR